MRGGLVVTRRTLLRVHIQQGVLDNLVCSDHG